MSAYLNAGGKLLLKAEQTSAAIPVGAQRLLLVSVQLNAKYARKELFEGANAGRHVIHEHFLLLPLLPVVISVLIAVVKLLQIWATLVLL